MRRFTLALALAALAVAGAARAQTNPRYVRAADRSAAAKIANATSAAPASISAGATVMDWPATAGGAPVQLRAGTNGWVCYPDDPGTEGNDPMCLDPQFQRWAQALIAKSTPQITAVGIGYMVAGGGSGSNTDPSAAGRAPDNEWGIDPPHLMIVVPDVRALEGLPTSRGAGGPWVMWKGTPYAHIMAPLQPRR